MKTKKLTFESNSSSSHSIYVANGCKRDVSPFRLNNEGVIEICCSEFGWEWETYHDAESKAAYLATRIINLTKFNNENREKCLAIKELFLNSIAKYCNCDINQVEITPYKEKGWNGKPDWGYIDHQSVDCADEVLEMGENGILDFIFCSASSLETGNDNDSD